MIIKDLCFKNESGGMQYPTSFDLNAMVISLWECLILTKSDEKIYSTD